MLAGTCRFSKENIAVPAAFISFWDKSGIHLRNREKNLKPAAFKKLFMN
jgi:hypothetical protein